MEGQQVRRLHIVYFLSRKGSLEPPHLIRVHHLSRNGVRLRDVKRWLGELRGKEVSDSFSWSYKRRYKTGYVWQDLLDDDLINPISDNEYVLKGSEISSPKVGKQKNQDSHEKASCNDVSTKSPSEIEEESLTFSSEASTLTDDSARHEKQISEDKIKSSSSSTFYAAFLGKKSSKKAKNDEEKVSKEEGKCSKSKNHSIIRNLMTCGEVGTNDSVKAMNKQNKACSSMCSSDVHSDSICRKEVFGGSQSQRIFGNSNWTQPQWNNRKSFDSSSKGAFKPIYGPNCSQCGKPFKPEKLHGHMKTCKGMKAVSKCGVAKAAESASKGSMEHQSVSGHLLT